MKNLILWLVITCSLSLMGQTKKGLYSVGNDTIIPIGEIKGQYLIDVIWHDSLAAAENDRVVVAGGDTIKKYQPSKLIKYEGIYRKYSQNVETLYLEKSKFNTVSRLVNNKTTLYLAYEILFLWIIFFILGFSLERKNSRNHFFKIGLFDFTDMRLGMLIIFLLGVAFFIWSFVWLGAKHQTLYDIIYYFSTSLILLYTSISLFFLSILKNLKKVKNILYGIFFVGICIAWYFTGHVQWGLVFLGYPVGIFVGYIFSYKNNKKNLNNEINWTEHKQTPR